MRKLENNGEDLSKAGSSRIELSLKSLLSSRGSIHETILHSFLVLLTVEGIEHNDEI